MAGYEAGYEPGNEPGNEQGTGAGSQAAALGLIAAFCRRLRGLAETLATASDSGAGSGSCFGDEFIVTAGGSAYFDVVTRELTAGGTAGMTVILRSGAYVTHDHGYYGTVSPAHRVPGVLGILGVLGTRRTRRCCGPRSSCGHRCCPAPSPAWPCSAPADATSASTRGCRCRCAPCAGACRAESPAQVTELNDQHAYLRLAAETALAPGDLVCLGISHPCTTLDKWRVIPVVRRRWPRDRYGARFFLSPAARKYRAFSIRGNCHPRPFG